MHEDEPRRRRGERLPVALSVRLAFGDVAEFVDRYATNISDGGVFIRSRDPRPVGTRLSFELRLRSGEIAFAGEGTVRWIETLDHRGLGTPGMGLQFDSLTDESRAVIDRILQRRTEDLAPPAVAGATPASWEPLDERNLPPPEPEPAPEDEAPPAPPVLAPVEPGSARAPGALQPLPSWIAGVARWTAATQGAPPAAPAPDSVLTSQVLASALTPAAPEPAERTEPLFASRQAFDRPPQTTDPMLRPVPRAGAPAAAPPIMSPVTAPGPVVSAGAGAASARGASPAVVAKAVPVVDAKAALASLGLDFGWSTLRLALARGEAVEAVALAHEPPTVPLCAAVRDGRLVAGQEAARAMEEGAAGVRGLAALLGAASGSAAARAWTRREVFGLAPAEDGSLRVRLGRITLDPREIVTALLAEVRAAASRQAGGEVRSVALALPPGLPPSRRRALREAALAAGFETVRLVPSPAACVLARHGPKGRRRVLVVDFGEGGCEASVVEQSAHVVEVVAHAGDPELGGAEIDLALLEAMLTQFEKESGLLVPEDAAVFVRVRNEAARTKIALGEAMEREVLLSNLVPAGLSKADLYQRVSRARLLALAAPFLERAMELVRAALAARNFGGADLDEILVVGAQGRVPSLVRRLAEKLGKEPVVPADAGGLAAIGAALLREGERGPGRYLAASVAGASFGFAGPGGTFRRVIDRAQGLPLERSYTAVTTTDGEQRLELALYLGERAQADENDRIGTVVAGPLPRAAKGEVRVAVTLALSEEGELSVRARDVSTGREVPCVVEPALPGPRPG